MLSGSRRVRGAHRIAVAMCATMCRMAAKKRRPRPGRTRSISVSLDEATYDALKKRAARLHGGNLSAVIIEMGAAAKRLEAMASFAAWAGFAPLTDEEREEVDREWRPVAPRKKRGRRAA